MTGRFRLIRTFPDKTIAVVEVPGCTDLLLDRDKALAWAEEFLIDSKPGASTDLVFEHTLTIPVRYF